MSGWEFQRLKRKKLTFVVWFSTSISPNYHIWIFRFLVLHILERAVTFSGTLSVRRWNYRKVRLLIKVIIHCRSSMGMPKYGHGWDIHDARRPASQRLLSLNSSGPPTAGAPEMKMTIMATSANKYKHKEIQCISPNVFVQMVKCTWPNWQMYWSKL